MNFSIKSKRQDKDTLITEVEFNFTESIDGIEKSITVPISHFQPQSVKEINNSISNRGQSELRALLAEKKIKEDLFNSL